MIIFRGILLVTAEGERRYGPRPDIMGFASVARAMLALGIARPLRVPARHGNLNSVCTVDVEP